MLTKAYLQKHYWDLGKSCSMIAKERGTYANDVRRSLLSYWPTIRTPSESRKIAMEKGYIKPPMAGRTHSHESRVKASQTAKNNHLQKDEAERQAIRDRARLRWEQASPAEKDKFLTAGETALRRARIAGSRLERGLCDGLNRAGILCELHGPFGDLFLSEAEVAIFVLPPVALAEAFGEERLEENEANHRVRKLRATGAGLRVIEIIPPGRPTLADTASFVEQVLTVLDLPAKKQKPVTTIGGPTHGPLQKN